MSHASDLFRDFASAIDAGYMSHLTEDDLNVIKRIFAELLNVDITYEQAATLTGRSLSGFCSRLSRSTIKPKLLRRSIKYRDALTLSK